MLGAAGLAVCCTSWAVCLSLAAPIPQHSGMQGPGIYMSCIEQAASGREAWHYEKYCQSTSRVQA